MAAASDAPLVEVCELRQVPLAELDALLEEEIGVWSRELSWDFRPSAELVHRFVQMQSLVGFALRVRNQLAGYAYQVCDERKGLIGDFYVRPSFHTSANENALLTAVVQNLTRTPGIRRIESQLMLLRPPAGHPLPFARWLTRHDRLFMAISGETVMALPVRHPSHRVRIQTWHDRMHEEAAHVISAAYRGHVDSEINDQYRNIPGARRFLTNIVRFPGCGRFSSGGSFAAIDEFTGRLCGLCLSSLVSADTGHITQLCVLPALRGTHVGYELLRHSLVSLVNSGCHSVSLTVTCTNADAVQLYESLGFHARCSFPALVWDDF
jgi:ribosomal protein S18 acetylase RimI-like enzyme